MDPKKLSALDKIIKTDYPNLAGLVVCHNGRRELEAYYNGFTAEHQFHVFSVTKSIVSLLIGIALERGEITGVDQKILDFFPEFQVRKGHELLRQVTLKHCLTMTVPYRFRFNPYTKYFTSDDWVSFALNQIGGRGQLGEFRYAPIIGPDILTGILTRATGKTVLDYAREHLFDPLGIAIEKSLFFETKEEQMDFYKATTNSCWVCGPNKINTAGWGLTLSAREMAAIGECCIHGGQDGKQIIPPSLAEGKHPHAKLLGKTKFELRLSVVDRGGSRTFVCGAGRRRQCDLRQSAEKPRRRDRVHVCAAGQRPDRLHPRSD